MYSIYLGTHMVYCDSFLYIVALYCREDEHLLEPGTRVIKYLRCSASWLIVYHLSRGHVVATALFLAYLALLHVRWIMASREYHGKSKLTTHHVRVPSQTLMVT